MRIGYTWSRFAHSPVEHVFDYDDMFARPLCGSRLNVGYQHTQEQPSGLEPLCQPCQVKLKKAKP